MLTKICNKCSLEKDLSVFRVRQNGNPRNICKMCEREYGRRHYWKNHDRLLQQAKDYQATPRGQRNRKEFKKKNYIAEKASERVRQAVRLGKLSRPNVCEACGVVTDIIEGHHPDYDRPMEVVWLCRPCHNRLHVELRRVA